MGALRDALRVRDRNTMYDQALLVDDPLFDEHRADGPHPERPERLTAARAACESASTVQFRRLAARDASDEELVRVHTPEYLTKLGQATGTTAQLDADTFVCPQSVSAARRAAGATAVLAEALTRGEAPWGVALVRPPGHHARPGAAMGFCLLNNVAVAAAHARALGVERVLVLDWDVHHGNGTQEMFYSDPHVLYISLHQYPYYPGSGAALDTGIGEGRGYTVNIPLSSGAGDAEYLAAFDRVVCPVVDSYRPGLVLVSAGYDAHVRDPLGGMSVSDAGYAQMARKLQDAAKPQCPIGLVLEGGYDLVGLRDGLAASFGALSKTRKPPEEGPGDPSGLHTAEIEQAALAIRKHWLHH